MHPRLIDNDGLQSWLEGVFHSGRRLIMPLTTEGSTFYREVKSPETIAVNFAGSELRPAKPYYSLKQFLFPITEPVLHYRRDNGGIAIEDVGEDGALSLDDREATADLVVFGATPCDAAALRVLDKVFLTPEIDPFYARRRKHMVVIGLSCPQAQPECFCTAVGLSPSSSEGCDLLVTPLRSGDESEDTINADYLVEVLTPAGEALLEAVEGKWKKHRSKKHEQAVMNTKALLDERARRPMETKPALGNAAAQLQTDFESPAWEAIGRKCLGCGLCAFVCPTCHCFDLADECTMTEGCRYKNWDSCCLPLFTLHASGHDPRPTQRERYRQRLMHKFSYFVETAGMNMCVGCGRCTTFCPVDIDIYEIRRQWQ